jgi:hypothetical protein
VLAELVPGGVAGAAGEGARTVRALGHRQQPRHTSMQRWDGAHHCIDAVI